MTLSNCHLKLLKQLHQDPDFGNTSVLYAPLVILLIDQYKANSISDYGAGKCSLKNKIIELGSSGSKYYPYDPAFPNYGTPRSADLVCCINVLEYVEPEFLEAVLLDLKKIINKVGLITIQFGPALKKFPDGRNTHLIQKPVSWWLPQLCIYFEILELESTSKGFWIVVEPRSSP